MTPRSIMRSMAGALLASLLLAVPAPAQVAASDADGRMLTPAEAAPFRGIGRLNVAGRRFCTATLISAREALTAAHCLFHPTTARRVPTSEMKFVAGLDRGSYAALRGVEATAIPPDFEFETRRPLRSLRRDLALVRLDAPIAAKDAAPLSVGVAEEPEGLAIVSYSRERSQALSIVRPCARLRERGNLVTLSCRITFGASGAPVLELNGGEARIYAVSSAIAQVFGQRHAATYVVRVDAGEVERLRAGLAR